MTKKHDLHADEDAPKSARRNLFTGAEAVDAVALKREIDHILHAAEGFGLVFGSIGIRTTLGFLQALHDDDDALEAAVEAVNAHR